MDFSGQLGRALRMNLILIRHPLNNVGLPPSNLLPTNFERGRKASVGDFPVDLLLRKRHVRLERIEVQ
jgi:hypothetical protein